MNKISELPQNIRLIITYVMCANVCASVRNSLNVIGWYVFMNFYQNPWLMFFFNFTAYSIMFWCGCFVGYLVPKKCIIHSSLAVALGVMFTFLLSRVGQDEYILLVEGVLTGAILGGIGGGFALIVREIWCLKNRV